MNILVISPTGTASDKVLLYKLFDNAKNLISNGYHSAIGSMVCNGFN